MSNQYQPWLETNEREAEYYKRLYLAARQEAHALAREKANAIVECAAADAKLTALTKALEEISKGRGPFSYNPLTHALNTVDAMKWCAIAALRGIAKDPKTKEAKDETPAKD